MIRSMLVLVLAVGWIASAQGADWTQFRGPGSNATSDDKGLPTQWSSTDNIVWKTELPGQGSSSPIVFKDRVFLTCYTGYGISPEAPGDKMDLMRHVVALTRKDGNILWTKSFKPATTPEDYVRNGARHGFSTSTPTTDGEKLYVFLATSGVFCFDFAGKEIWQVDVGAGEHQWGSGNSLVLHGDLLIVNASVESGSLLALNKQTGKQVWRVEGIRNCWNTPVLVEVPGGKKELVLSLPGRSEGRIVGYDPDSGKELWHCTGIADGYLCPSVVAHDGVVYAIGGRTNTAVAVKAGGRGEVTELWRTGKGSNVSSPVYHDGHLYWCHESRGVVYCLNAENGEVVYEERLRPGPDLIYASMTYADGKLYAVSQTRGAFVIAAKPQFELLAHNVFSDDNSRINASPVISNGQLLLRSDRYLYCIDEK